MHTSEAGNVLLRLKVKDLAKHKVDLDLLIQANTNPLNGDTDGDGLLASVESNAGVFVGATDTGTDPTLVDTDSYGLSDGVETNTGILVNANDTDGSPVDQDTDGDGADDEMEVAAGTNPSNNTQAAVTPITPTLTPTAPTLQWMAVGPQAMSCSESWRSILVMLSTVYAGTFAFDPVYKGVFKNTNGRRDLGRGHARPPQSGCRGAGDHSRCGVKPEPRVDCSVAAGNQTIPHRLWQRGCKGVHAQDADFANAIVAEWHVR